MSRADAHKPPPRAGSWDRSTILASTGRSWQRPHQSPIPTRIRSAAVGAVIGAIVVVTAYGYLSPSPPSAPSASVSLRPPSAAQMAGLQRTIAADWSRARGADLVWADECSGRQAITLCAHALHAQIHALRRLVDDISAEKLAGTTLAPLVYDRFLPAVGSALAAKHAAARDIAAGNVAGFKRDDQDPMICIGPINAALRRGLGRFAGAPVLSYGGIFRRAC